MLRRLPAYSARWCSTRPPVAMPLAARITMGPCRLARALDCSGVSIMVAACAMACDRARAQAVVVRVLVEQVCSVDGHRAVEEHRQTARDGTTGLELRDGMQHVPALAPRRTPARRPRPPRPASRCSAGPSSASEVFLGVQAVAVGGLDQHRVGGRRVGRRVHQQVVGTTEVAREQDAVPAHFQKQAGRAQDVAGGREGGPPAANGLEGLAERLRVDPAQAVQRIAACVQRQRRCVFRKAVPVGEGGVFFLDVAAVGQKDAAEVARAGGGVHPSVKAFAHQHRQVAAVVQVGVGQDDGMDLAGHHRKGPPVAQAQLLVALEQPAVD
jgi:hypothetical protein